MKCNRAVINPVYARYDYGFWIIFDFLGQGFKPANCSFTMCIYLGVTHILCKQIFCPFLVPKNCFLEVELFPQNDLFHLILLSYCPNWWYEIKIDRINLLLESELFAQRVLFCYWSIIWYSKSNFLNRFLLPPVFHLFLKIQAF